MNQIVFIPGHGPQTTETAPPTPERIQFQENCISVVVTIAAIALVWLIWSAALGEKHDD